MHKGLIGNALVDALFIELNESDDIKHNGKITSYIGDGWFILSYSSAIDGSEVHKSISNISDIQRLLLFSSKESLREYAKHSHERTNLKMRRMD